MSNSTQIPFGDLKRQYVSLKPAIDAAVTQTMESGWFVLGKRLEQFEQLFADYCGATFCVGVGSGTEALQIALLSLGVAPGDEVITVTNTCVPTVSAISSTGARTVLTDVYENSMTMDVEDLRRKITPRTKAIIPVDLYGQAADLESIHIIAKENNIPVVEDAAQAHGTSYGGKRIGSLSSLTCFSFYPSKNLGAFGDGGAITTDDAQKAEAMRMIRNYGQRVRYYHDIKGINSRLDEIQAAILTAKLPHLEGWNKRRREIARRYLTEIQNPHVIRPQERPYGQSNFHLFVVRTEPRDQFQAYLTSCGISTVIHYPVPIHLQRAFADLGYHRGDFPVAERLSDEIVSLPIFPELTEAEIDTVIRCVNEFRG